MKIHLVVVWTCHGHHATAALHPHHFLPHCRLLLGANMTFGCSLNIVQACLEGCIIWQGRGPYICKKRFFPSCRPFSRSLAVPEFFLVLFTGYLFPDAGACRLEAVGGRLRLVLRRTGSLRQSALPSTSVSVTPQPKHFSEPRKGPRIRDNWSLPSEWRDRDAFTAWASNTITLSHPHLMSWSPDISSSLKYHGIYLPKEILEQ